MLVVVGCRGPVSVLMCVRVRVRVRSTADTVDGRRWTVDGRRWTVSKSVASVPKPESFSVLCGCKGRKVINKASK